MKSKKCDIELPFETAMLTKDLKDIKQNLLDAVDLEDCPEDVTILIGVVENLEELLKKNPEKADLHTKVSIIAHFTLLQELVSYLEGQDEFDEEFEDDDEELDDEADLEELEER